MYWFRRPPYLRWTAATLVVLCALWMDLRPEQTEPRPFAGVAIEIGSPLTPETIEVREVPVGLLPPVDLDGYAVTHIEPGEPITAALVTDRAPLPVGWWALEMEVPSGVSAGTGLQLVVEESTVPARVTIVVESDPAVAWSRTTAMVAVPAEQAAAVATAVAQGLVSVLVEEW